MLTYQDAKWAARMETAIRNTSVPLATRMAELVSNDPDFHDRCGIRSVYDGRYRFSRYFSPLDFHTPATFESLIARNDLELYDLRDDPEEVRNLAADPKASGDLIMAMNAVLNARIAEEVGEDDGRFLPIRNGKWFLPPYTGRP
jgi:arylsulfatase A-like enzyme